MLLLPRRWIHEVKTEEDAVVFGLNFIESDFESMEMSACAYGEEREIERHYEQCYPDFELLMLLQMYYSFRADVFSLVFPSVLATLEKHNLKHQLPSAVAIIVKHVSLNSYS